jgi:hypothetical protein
VDPPCKAHGGVHLLERSTYVLLVLVVIHSSRQKAVQASEGGPLTGKVHLVKGPLSVAPLYALVHTRGTSHCQTELVCPSTRPCSFVFCLLARKGARRPDRFSQKNRIRLSSERRSTARQIQSKRTEFVCPSSTRPCSFVFLL